MATLNTARTILRSGYRPNTLPWQTVCQARCISQARKPLAHVEAGTNSQSLRNNQYSVYAPSRDDTVYRLEVGKFPGVKSGTGILRVSRQRELPTGNRTSTDQTFAVPHLWLRENCQCAQCIHPDTRQREIDVFSLLEEPSIREASNIGQNVEVLWSDGHHSVYTQEWFQKAGKLTQMHKEFQHPPDKKYTYWSQDTFASGNYPSVPYEDVMQTSEGLKSWLLRLRQYGFCFIDGCPIDPDATRGLLERIGPIRNTHYGAFYDFTSNLSSKDTAYTQQGLGLHTDTTYFSEPAGLQMFHMMSHTDGEGGESTLADGFAAAKELKEQDPEAYEMLSRMKLVWHASGNEGISIVPNTPAPVLLHDEVTGNLEQVRWNNADRGTLDLIQAETIPNGAEKWYNAARMFDSLLKKYLVQVQMEPGKPLIFDNWRVLHGRTAFTGKRRVAGGYISRDDFMSRYKMSAWGPDQVLKAPIV